MIYSLVTSTNEGVESVFSFDSVTSFDETWSATVTTQTVEKGFNITDNINIEPPTFSIEAILSSYSLFDLEKEIVWNGSGFGSAQPNNNNRHIAARESLLKLFISRIPFTLYETAANSNAKDPTTALSELKSGYSKEFSTCVITSLSISPPPNGGGAFYVSMKIQEIYAASIFYQELRADEVPRALIPLLQDSESKSGAATVTEDGNPDAAAIKATDLIEDTLGGKDKGMSFEDGAAIAYRETSILERELSIAEGLAKELGAVNGELYLPDVREDGSIGIKTKRRD